MQSIADLRQSKCRDCGLLKPRQDRNWCPGRGKQGIRVFAHQFGKSGGISGMAVLRRGLVIAKARNEPARTCGCNESIVSKASGISPASRAVTVGPPPR